jgi:tetratricopeptide (TPR) repeat protein
MSRRKGTSRRATPIRSEIETPFSPRLRLLAVVSLIAVVTCVAYLPAMHGSLIWDDDAHVTKPALRSLEGLYRIWFDLGATQQYYPLLHSAFWVQYKLWGEATFGYHVVSLLLHITAACLVYCILLRLRIPGAIMAAAIFALHPVHVESVAWISEQKNTLSAVFYLSAMLACLQFDETRKRLPYFVALGLFVLGLLSKTVTATLPAALPVIFWWQRGTLSWRRDVQPLIPFFLLGAVAGLFTAWVERNLIGAQGADFELTLLQRSLLAGRAIWFYLGKLVWPTELIFIYPRWDISPYVWWQWLPPIAAVAVLVCLWSIRKRWRAPLAGWLLFVGTLFPVLGFLNVYPFIFSFVADHFQYLASIGMIVLAGSGIALGLKRLPPRARWVGDVTYLFLIVALAALTWRQSHMYKDVIALYQTTVDRNPTCWMAHYSLGNELARLGQTQKAIQHYRETIELNPDYARAYNNLGTALAALGQTGEAIEQYQQALRLNPDFALAHYNLGRHFANRGETQQAMEYLLRATELNPGLSEPHHSLGNLLASAGRTAEAIEQYRKALQIVPHSAVMLTNLGIQLAGSGQTQEAVEAFRQALRVDPHYAAAHYNLGVAFAKAGRLPEAIAEFQKNLRLKPNQWQTHLVLAKVLTQAGRLSEAVEHCVEATRLAPQDPTARNDSGTVLLEVGRIQEAIAQFEEAVKIDPKSALGRFNLAKAYARANQRQQAIAFAKRARELARSANQPGLAEQIESWIEEYSGNLADVPGSASRASGDAPPRAEDEKRP